MIDKSQIYTIVQSKEDSHATGWAFLSPERFEQIYYQFPELNKDEVRIRILSTGLCASDYLYGRGHWGQKQYPIITGHEIVGEIDTLGEDVNNFKKGDIVMLGPLRDFCGNCEHCNINKTNVCQEIEHGDKKLYGKYWGGYSTHLQVPCKMVFKMPSKLDIKTIPPLMCAGITTFTPLKLHLKKGQKLAVLGCGGLGHFAIQWGQKMGAHVDVFSSSHKKDDLIKKLGGQDIIIWTEGEHKKLTNKYDVIINTLSCNLDQQGSVEWDSFINCLKPYGVFIQVGVPESQSKMVFSPGLLIQKMITVFGSYIGGLENYQQMFEFVQQHGILCMSEVYSWQDFPKALQRLEKESPMFRCVVDVDPESKKYLQQSFNKNSIYQQPNS